VTRRKASTKAVCAQRIGHCKASNYAKKRVAWGERLFGSLSTCIQEVLPDFSRQRDLEIAISESHVDACFQNASRRRGMYVLGHRFSA
jgi:hypothetical protein